MTDLPTHLRKWGLKVEPVANWKTNGRPFSFKPRAIMAHHTASSRKSGNFGAQGVVVNGRPGLPGPLCQFLLGRDGTVRIVSRNYANHAGYGGPIAGIPQNMGNTYSWGIEAENDGLGELWSKEQINAYYRLCAALLKWMDESDVSKVIGHKEWAPGRKPDPAGIDMKNFRKQVAAALKAGPSVKTVLLKNLRPGAVNNDVRIIKRRLARRGFMKKPVTGFTKRFNKKTRAAYRKYQLSLGYTGMDADGIPGPASLRKLGLNSK